MPKPRGIAMLLWSADISVPSRLATPFFCAAAAAALDARVEVYFSAGSVRLLEPGVAQSLRASEHPKTILESMQEAVAHGAVFFACRDALQAHGLRNDQLISECRQFGGAVQFMARAMDRDWTTLVF